MGLSTSSCTKWHSAQSIPSMLVPELRPRTVKSRAGRWGIAAGIVVEIQLLETQVRNGSHLEHQLI